MLHIKFSCIVSTALVCINFNGMYLIIIINEIIIYYLLFIKYIHMLAALCIRMFFYFIISYKNIKFCLLDKCFMTLHNLHMSMPINFREFNLKYVEILSHKTIVISGTVVTTIN